MVGDTNIFFHKNDNGQLIGETEIMVAEKTARGGRRGWEAMLLMMRYGKITSIQYVRYQFKIHHFSQSMSESVFGITGG